MLYSSYIMNIKYLAKKKHYGLNRVIWEIEDLFLNYRYFHTKMYYLWFSLTENDRERIKARIGGIIKEFILNNEYWEAIAMDILQNGVINIESNMYKYLKKTMFDGKDTEILKWLRDVLDNKGNG